MALARHRTDSPLIMRHCGPNGSRQPHTTSSWTGHRRELDYFRVGCELEANRNFSVRVVADRASTQSISTAFGGPSRIKAVHDRLSDPADLPKNVKSHTRLSEGGSSASGHGLGEAVPGRHYVT